MVLTKELFEKARSSKGAFSSKQVKLLGLKFNDLWKGWERDVIGESYHEKTIQKFIELKDKHLKKPFIPKEQYTFNRQNYETINEAKSNLIEGFRKIDCND
jgi:hypothetical protein